MKDGLYRMEMYTYFLTDFMRIKYLGQNLSVVYKYFINYIRIYFKIFPKKWNITILYCTAFLCPGLELGQFGLKMAFLKYAGGTRVSQINYMLLTF